MITFAEDLGRILGTTQAKATEWLNQRQDIAKQLTQVRDTAERLLSELRSSGAKLAATVRRGRKTTSSERPARTRISAEARKRMSEAAKKRWAEIKAKRGKTKKVSIAIRRSK
jgi:hypothetical protein